jgi:hypothetical protein
VPVCTTAKKEIKKLSIARHLLVILISGSFALGLFIGAGMGLFRPHLTIKNEGMPESMDGSFKYMHESREAKDAQGHLASKALKPFQCS